MTFANFLQLLSEEITRRAHARLFQRPDLRLNPKAWVRTWHNPVHALLCQKLDFLLLLLHDEVFLEVILQGMSAVVAELAARLGLQISSWSGPLKRRDAHCVAGLHVEVLHVVVGLTNRQLWSQLRFEFNYSWFWCPLGLSSRRSYLCLYRFTVNSLLNLFSLLVRRRFLIASIKFQLYDFQWLYRALSVSFGAQSCPHVWPEDRAGIVFHVATDLNARFRDCNVYVGQPRWLKLSRIFVCKALQRLVNLVLNRLLAVVMVWKRFLKFLTRCRASQLGKIGLREPWYGWLLIKSNSWCRLWS